MTGDDAVLHASYIGELETSQQLTTIPCSAEERKR